MMIRDYTHGKEDLKTISISYIRALDFVKVYNFKMQLNKYSKVLLRIFQHDVSVPKPIDEYAARVIVDGVFSKFDLILSFLLIMNILIVIRF